MVKQASLLYNGHLEYTQMSNLLQTLKEETQLQLCVLFTSRPLTKELEKTEIRKQ